MGLGDLVREASRDRVVAVGPWLFRVRRVNSDDLRRVGWAELEGSAAAREARQQVQDQAAVERARHLGGDAQADRKAAMVEADRRRQAAATFARMTSTPEGERAWVQRCDAYIRACVTHAGRVSGDALPDAVTVLELEQVADVAHELEPGVYLHPARIVLEETEQDLDATPARVWVHHLTAEQRILLGTVLIRLQSVAGEVRPFRGARGATSADRADGEGVRQDAARDPALGAGRGGAGGGGPRRDGPGDGGGVRGGAADGGGGPAAVTAAG